MPFFIDNISPQLDNLREEISMNRVLVSALTSGERPLAGDLGLALRRQRVSLYSRVIVGCYGTLQEGVELIVLELVRMLKAASPTVEDLPGDMWKRYRNLVLTCLRDAPLVRGTVDEGLALRSLLEDPGQPGLIEEAVFTIFSGNYRANVISSKFTQLGVGNVHLEERLQDFWGSSEQATGQATASSFLEDLVSRRNEIVHSAQPIADILTPPVLASWIDAVEVILEHLWNLGRSFVATHIATTVGITPSGTIQNIFSKLGVAKVSWTGPRVSVGDPVVLARNGACEIRVIKEIQRFGKSVTSAQGVDGHPDVVGVVFAGGCPHKNGWVLYARDSPLFSIYAA